jgi:hypothetical protein
MQQWGYQGVEGALALGESQQQQQLEPQLVQ